MDKQSLAWRAWERYVILAYDEQDNDLTEEEGDGDQERLTPADVDNRVDFARHASSKPIASNSAMGDCSTSLEQSINELQLMRIELRGRGIGDEDGNDHGQRLLYLGDVHTDRTQRPYYRPQSYQQPLVADDAARGFAECRVCAAVSESSTFYPPTLSPVVHRRRRQRGLEVRSLLPGSSWASELCETRPYGVFVLRRMSFGWGAGRLLRVADFGGDWKEEFDYYNDPLCHSLSYTVHASGRYVVVGDAETFDDAGRVVEADFGVDRVSVVVWEPRLLDTVRAGSDCGPVGVSWAVGVERDVTATDGCAALGVRAPTTTGAVVPQLLAAERRHHDALLLVGESASAPVHAGSTAKTQRPTSFQPPLRRCVAADVDDAGEMMADASWSDRRRAGGAIASRIWRHVTPSTASREVAHAVAAAAANVAVATIWWIIAR